jgi:hypothetical protein
MNYIELINQFWRLNEEHSFTTAELAVYFYLLNTANKLAWKNPFNQSNGYIINALNISEPTLIRVRNNLKNYGLIDFKSDKGRKNLTLYTIKYLNGFSNIVSIPISNGTDTNSKYLNSFSIPDSISVSNNDSNTVSIHSENTLDNNKHKINKTKLNNEEGESAAGSDSLVSDPVSNVPPSSARPPMSNLFIDVDELKQQCLQDQIFYEQLCMKLHLSVPVLEGWLGAFNRELKFAGEVRKLSKDYRLHFSRWLPYQDLASDPKQHSTVKETNNGNRKTNTSDSKPRGVVISGEKDYGQF